MRSYTMACGSKLSYDVGLLEVLAVVEPDTCGLVRRLERPPDRIYVRVNTLKTNVDEYLEMLRDSGIQMYKDEELPEAIWAPVKGPIRLDVEGRRKVVADKRAAESVMMGSNLYAPGVLYAEGVSRGDKVTVVGPNGEPVAVGTAVMSWEEVKARRKGIAVRVEASLYQAIRVSELPGYDRGLVYGQSLPSMYASRILDPSPGELVVDMNAAPGGKTGHIYQLSGGRAMIVAVDRPSKTGKLREVLARLRAEGVKVLGGDSRKLSQILPGLVGKVDAIIIDPPCTNLGVIPKLWDKKTLRDAVTLARYQRGFIREAYRLLRRGGRLLYSTCTLTPVEDEVNIRYAEDIGFERIGVPRWVGRGSKSSLGLRFHPNRHGTPGFFIGPLLIKRGG